MSNQLSEERKMQLRRAHAAIDIGDYGLAAAWFGEDLEGFLERVSAVLLRTDIPVKPRKPSDPKPPKPPATKKKTLNKEYAAKRIQAVEVLRAIPSMNVRLLAERLGVEDKFIHRLKREMGIPANVNGKGLRKKVMDLLAEDPQITNRELARQASCSENYATHLRKRWRDQGGPETGRS